MRFNQELQERTGCGTDSVLEAPSCSVIFLVSMATIIRNLGVSYCNTRGRISELRCPEEDYPSAVAEHHKFNTGSLANFTLGALSTRCCKLALGKHFK